MMELTNNRQRKILQRIFKRPTPNDIPWSDIVTLFEHLGFTVEYGTGSKTKVMADAKAFFCHRPHPSNQTDPCIVRNIRNFLAEIGVTP
jgi:hypothetical protein